MTASGKSRGIASRDFLRSLIDGQEVIIETVKDRRGKYGRYLAEIWMEKTTVGSTLTTPSSPPAVYQEY